MSHASLTTTLVLNGANSRQVRSKICFEHRRLGSPFRSVGRNRPPGMCGNVQTSGREDGLLASSGTFYWGGPARAAEQYRRDTRTRRSPSFSPPNAPACFASAPGLAHEYHHEVLDFASLAAPGCCNAPTRVGEKQRRAPAALLTAFGDGLV